jgi:hypothetical protein
MPVIEAQCASILVPHDHRHINQIRMPGEPLAGAVVFRRLADAWRAAWAASSAH